MSKEDIKRNIERYDVLHGEISKMKTELNYMESEFNSLLRKLSVVEVDTYVRMLKGCEEKIRDIKNEFNKEEEPLTVGFIFQTKAKIYELNEEYREIYECINVLMHIRSHGPIEKEKNSEEYIEFNRKLDKILFSKYTCSE